jgi:methylated-DNA-[protein]-cysteine S-methyltransferase
MLNMNKIPSHIQEKLQKLPAFQRHVYQICAQIPEGQVRTYAWIAERVGKPGAARAVGTALSKNPFAPIIPCHRVIRSDGRMGGYSGPGGVGGKKRLLTAEGWEKNVN